MDTNDTKQKSDRALREEKVLEFWKKNEVFKKTLEKKAPKGEFVFFEGPPTANGRPGIHHIEARSFKDAIPRYRTMRGYRVGRKGGWDTHGLPVELEVEKQLGLKSKKEIEQYGIAKFNEECKKSVWKYVDEWRQFTDRMGYWVDSDNPYVTYHNSYIEALWGVLSHVEDRNLLYKDYKVLPWCPRCGTALSSHELAQGYADVKDLSVYAKFKLVDFPNAYFVAWTTTPWTLPGNVALAVGADIDYVEVKVGEEILVLAKERLSVLSEPYEIVAEHKGSEMVGMGYEPLYPFLKDTYKGDGLEKAFKVYTADFVTTTDGTGIVHTAVMYGQDDFVLGSQIGLPKYHTVDDTGHFKPGAGFLAGRFVKDEETAVEIIKDLAHRGLLFKKEKYEHSYPHCWRCKTPLIYYARDSWYIAMSKLRDELVKENEKINWEPEHIKEGRFGEWLREIKDWAISRERYWGTPLPIWENADKSQRIIVDSLETIKKHTKKNGNTFFFVRHGEGQHNVEDICSSEPDYPHHITEKGREHVLATAEKLKGKRVDLMIRSPFVRAQETAELIAETIGFAKEKIEVDERIREYKFGDFHLKPWKEYAAFRKGHEFDMDFVVPHGESLQEAKNRFGEFLHELESRYQDKNIVVVTHGIGFQVAPAVSEYADKEKSAQIIRRGYRNVPDGSLMEFSFTKLPHNKDFELDLHRPYIDEVVLVKDGEEYRRVKEVMDVWFDSGAMPFAQDPGNVRFPADFISEAIDQTRGWFYTLHAVGVLMGKGHAYNNVICLGHILDKEGKKMSKSVGNVVNPWEMMDKYGVDALRLWMYSVNQPGESKNFDERTVDEIQKRVFNLLDNVYSFYELYRDKNVEMERYQESKNILDRWIVARLSWIVSYMTAKLDAFELLTPNRELRSFVDDLSTWYLRRSRERIKEGDKEAKQTLYFVLKELTKLMAPFAPFVSEDLYQKLRLETDPLSVHLEKWPEEKKSFLSTFIPQKTNDVLPKMEETRRVITLALEARSKANIKVRQPLAQLALKDELPEEYLEIIKDELNVKKVIVNSSIEGEILLDTSLTPELIEEGKMRDAIRAIQEWRKEQNLKPGEKAQYTIPEGEEELFQKYALEIKRVTNVEF